MQVKGIGSLVALIVCVVLFASVLLPVMSSATEDFKVNNTLGFTATIADADDDVDTVFTWTLDDGLKCDGFIYPSSNDAAFFSDVCLMVVYSFSPYCSFIYGGVAINNPQSISVIINDGQIKANWVDANSTAGEVTLDYNWVVYRNNAGTDRIFNTTASPKTVYFSDDSPIYCVRALSSYPIGIVGDKATYMGSEYDVTVNGTAYKDEISQATLYSQAPSDVSVEINNSVYYPQYGAVAGQIVSSQDSTLMSMLGIIPILVVVGIILAAIQFIRMRD